jgi:hypothetical protein
VKAAAHAIPVGAARQLHKTRIESHLPGGEERRVREHIRKIIHEARRSPRTATAEHLAINCIRLARIAAAVHMTHAAMLLRDAPTVQEQQP